MTERVFKELEAYVRNHGITNFKELQERFGLSEAQLRTYLAILGFDFEASDNTECDRQCHSCKFKHLCG